MNEKNDENLKDEQTPENSDQKPSSEEPSADQQAGAEESATTGGRGEFHKNKKKSKNFANLGDCYFSYRVASLLHDTKTRFSTEDGEYNNYTGS